MGKNSKRRREHKAQEAQKQHPQNPQKTNEKPRFWVILKTHPLVSSITGTILSGLVFWGLSMIPPSTPHNGISIIILALAVAGIIWALIFSRRIKTRGGKMIFYFGIAFLVIGFGLIVSQMDFKSDISAQTQNTPTNLAVPQIPTFIDLSKVDPGQKVTLTLGGASASWSLSVLEKEKKTAFNISGAEIKMYVINGMLYIDADVSDGVGGYPVQIRGYGFLVNPSNWDKNCDHNAFEVVNQNGKPVFQLILESPYHFIIYGIFPMSGGGVVWADESGLSINPSPFNIFNLEPIFKYPSSQFPGQRITP